MTAVGGFGWIGFIAPACQRFVACVGVVNYCVESRGVVSSLWREKIAESVGAKLEFVFCVKF